MKMSQKNKEFEKLNKAVKYITSSRDGTIKVWYGNTTKAEKTIEVGIVKNKKNNKVNTYWINCIQYMTKSKRLVAA
jgi:hypothetical protein